MRIVESLEESGLLIKRISETVKNELKEQKSWISFNVIRNFSYCYIRKRITKKRGSKSRWRSNKNRWKFLMPPHPLTNFEIQTYYQNKPKFNGVFSRNNLSNMKDGAYIEISMTMNQ